MPEFSAHPGLVLFLFNILTLWPLVRVYRRAGLSPWLALLVFVPVLGLTLVLGLLTLRRWPARALAAPAVPRRKERRIA